MYSDLAFVPRIGAVQAEEEEEEEETYEEMMDRLTAHTRRQIIFLGSRKKIKGQHRSV